LLLLSTPKFYKLQPRMLLTTKTSLGYKYHTFIRP